MTPSSATEVSDAVRFDSVLPLTLLTLACVFVLGVIGILFWRERRQATRPRFLPFLFLLRVSAVAGVWIALINPTAVRHTRQAELKRGALYLDTSASMNIQDTGGSLGNSARWSAAVSGLSPAFGPLDDAVALLSTARTNLSLAVEAVSANQVRERLSRVEGAVREARSQIDRSRKFDGLNGRLDPLLSHLDGEVLGAVAQLRMLAEPGTESKEGLRAPLVSLGSKVSELRDNIRVIADEIHAQANTTTTKLGALPRIEFARRWLDSAESDWLGRLARETALDRNQFSQVISPAPESWKNVKAIDPGEAGTTTDLQTVLNELSRRASDGNLDFAILATDGGHNAGDQPLVMPEALAGTPVFIVPFGDYASQRDIDLRKLEAPKSILVRDQLIVKARVAGLLCEGESTSVELLNGSQVLDTKEVRFESRRAEKFVELRWQPNAPGTAELTVRVRPVAREVSLANNERTLKISVVEDRFDVLVADSMARWETRYLFSLFRREEQSKTTTLLFNPVHAYPGGKLPSNPALPLLLGAWQQFQVVILGDLSPGQLTPDHQKLLKQFVENGGHLIVIAGAESMPQAFADGPLADLLPVERETAVPPPNGYTLKLTAEGLMTDVLRISDTGVENDAALWRSIYDTLPIYDVSPWSKPKPSARVLIQAVPRGDDKGEGRVFLATHTFGKGSVAYFSSPTTYYLRWTVGDRYHYRFWGQLVRALVANDFGSGTPVLRMTTDQTSYAPGSIVAVKVHAQTASGAPLKGLSGQIAAHQLDKVIARAALRENPEVAGEYVAAFDGLPPGPIKLEPEGEGVDQLLKSTSAEKPTLGISMEMGAGNPEMVPSPEPPPFFSMAENTPTGMLVAPSALPAALQYFDFAPTITETTLRRPLWDEWWLLEAIIGCLVLEWIGRKIAGLI